MFGLEGCASAVGHGPLPPYVVQPEDVTPGRSTYFATVCQQCEAGCGVVVRTFNGRAKKIEGNPIHPVSMGRLSALGQAGLQQLYNPDRIQEPLRLRGKRGSRDYEAISWDDAISTLAGKLKDAAGTPNSLALLTQPFFGSEGHLIQLFMSALGSNRLLTFGRLGRQTALRAAQMSFGWNTMPHLDIENARYLISFGAELFGTWLSPVRYNIGFGAFRQGRPNIRGRYVHVEPRLSQTGANADEWVPVRPGTEGILALGMARAMIDQRLVQASTLPQPLQALINRYTLDQVASLTDVPADMITTLAFDFIANGPSIAVGGSSAAGHTNSLAALVAINALNYLAGSVGQTGGLIFSPGSPLPNVPFSQPATLGATEGPGQRYEWRRGKGRPGPRGRPRLLSAPGAAVRPSAPGRALHRQLQQLHGRYDSPGGPDPTGPHLPGKLGRSGAATGCSSGHSGPPSASGQPGLQHTPVRRHPPGFGTTGGRGPGLSPSLEDLLRLPQRSWGTIQKLNRGSVVNPNLDQFWIQAQAQGGWWDTQLPSNVPAPSPQSGASGLVLDAPRFAGDAKDFPFVLHAYESLALGEGSAANLPWLQELPDPMTTACWGTWVEINPAIAGQMGIKDGDIVEVESPSGKLQAPAYTFPALRPDVIAMPMGQGHSQYGRYAQNRGANPLSILSAQAQDGTDELAWSATRVRIRKTGQSGGLFLFQRLTKELSLDGTTLPQQE